ncbi:arginine exporter protein ArgO [Kribbella sp. VKM Ac-2527]|uniref:Arginine exporter protein ArgO n=1 Tax=Kribbella caucasensis TaxID=2512215 RepID=A0A4R6JGT7_9ACTN|nr:LysE family transporter [Kribbella sp. VKM Ac-2527]TDO35253.1 arginine exporter protein ArgO [Kribbella sp. VKM Ac-2527]
MIAALVAGLLAGYGIAIPVGAIGTYLVALTARTTLKVGASAALGVATADGLYALIATVAGSAIAPALTPITTPLKWFSVLVLLAMAARGATRAITQYRRLQSTNNAAQTPPNPTRAYLNLLGMTLLNPTTIIYFTAVVLGAQATATTPSYLQQSLFILAAYLASASWQLLLATGGAVLGRLLTTPRARLITALTSSTLITVLALQVLRSTL